MAPGEGIVILGAGAGGLHVALALDRLLLGRRDYPVLLVDQNDDHQVFPRLPDVAAGALPPRAATLPLRRLLSGRRIGFLRAAARGIRPAEREVVTDAGPLQYRWLVVALDGVPATGGVVGAAEHAMFLRSADDARLIAGSVDESFRQSAWRLDPAERERLSTVVVVGAGRTGVEAAAALADRAHALAMHYRLPAGVGRVILIEQAERILPGYRRDLGELARAGLVRRGVEIRLDSAVARVAGETVTLANGEAILRGVLVWAGGVRASDQVRASGLPITEDGRLVVDRQLRSVARSDVYAVGEGCAVVGEEINPDQSSAQIAFEHGDVVAHNLLAEIAGQAPREYRSVPRDVVVSLGRGDAVALVRGVVLTGWRALAAKRVSELQYLEAIGGPAGVVVGLLGGR